MGVRGEGGGFLWRDFGLGAAPCCPACAEGPTLLSALSLLSCPGGGASTETLLRSQRRCSCRLLADCCPCESSWGERGKEQPLIPLPGATDILAYLRGSAVCSLYISLVWANSLCSGPVFVEAGNSRSSRGLIPLIMLSVDQSSL